MIRRLTLTTLAATAIGVLAITGIASANRNDATADCATGLTFNMPRGEDGTKVLVYLDSNPTPVREFEITTFGAPLAFTVPTPDSTRPHVWTVVVDSRYNDDQRKVIPVDRCPAATTTTSTTTTSTTVPAPTTTQPSTTGSTIVTTPRQPGTTTAPAVDLGTTTTIGWWFLPETGPDDHTTSVIPAAALAALAAGTGLVMLSRIRRRSQR